MTDNNLAGGAADLFGGVGSSTVEGVSELAGAFSLVPNHSPPQLTCVLVDAPLLLCVFAGTICSESPVYENRDGRITWRSVLCGELAAFRKLHCFVFPSLTSFLVDACTYWL